MHQPDPLNDIYWLSIKKAYEAAKDPDVPLDRVPEFVDAASFFGVRLGKTEDDVMRDCIDYSIFEEQRSGERG